MLDPIGIIKIAETKGVAMIDRFSKLYKESAVKKAEQKLSLQLSKSGRPSKNGTGSGPKITEGPRIKEKFLVTKKQSLKSFKFL